MSACPTKTAITDSELSQIFTNGVKSGILPGTMPGTSDRDSNGMLTQNTIQAIIYSLKGSGIIPSPKTSNPEIFAIKQKELLKDIQSEYCFYESRYKYSLEQLFTSISTGYNNNTSDVQTTIQKYLESTQLLNKKVNDLIQIINGITEDMLSTTTEIETEIKTFDKQMREEKDKLAKQNKIISSNQASVQINKQMVKFTEQKAKYSNNLLGLYSFLNIVALGLLIYVYKSAGE